MLLKWLLLSFGRVTTALQAGGPWAWLNGEIRKVDAQRQVLESALTAFQASAQPQPHERAVFHSGFAPRVRWVQVDLGVERELDAFVVVPAMLGSPEAHGFPRRFKVDADGQVVFDSTNADFANPGDFSTPSLQAQTIRITTTRLWERSGDFVFALAELQAFAGGKNLALGSAVTSSGETMTGAWKSEYLVDGLSSSGVLIDEDEWLSGPSKRRKLSAELGTLASAQDAALSVAQARAVWLADLILLGVASFAVAAVSQSRRVREREMEKLRQRISRDLYDEIA